MKFYQFRISLLFTLLIVFSVSAAVQNVICVPWQGEPTRYHTAISGLSIRLKAVVKTDNGSQFWYKWVYGDGTETAISTSSGSRVNLQTDHTYNGVIGTPFTAQLVVANNNALANPIIDNYLVKIEENNLDARVNVAIDNGLWFLYTNCSIRMNAGRQEFYCSYSGYYSSPTASVVQAFEINGHKETGNFNQDPYAEAVAGGLTFLIYNCINPVNIGLQHGNNPDTNLNGKGISVINSRPIYEGGMVVDAFISSGTPGKESGRDFDGNGLSETYLEIVQDMCDMYAYGQYDGVASFYNYAAGQTQSGIIGGWRYNWQDWPDNSACQWAAICMIPAEREWLCQIPDWVKILNNNWLYYSYCDTCYAGQAGFGYTGASWGDATTPSGMVQLAFSGNTTDDYRWRRCEDWFADNWVAGRNWLNQNNVYAYFALAKAMRLAKPEPVVSFRKNNFDWYRGSATTSGLAKKISDYLITNHGWDYYGANLGTAWCVITLKPVLFGEAPIACFDADPNPSYPDAAIIFDPTCSGHSAAGKTIDNLIKLEWDWNNDGVFDEFTTTPQLVTHTFPCPGLQQNPPVGCMFPVTLRVTDDNSPVRTATYVTNINITNPPHPPVAVAHGPYIVSLCPGDTLTLDGTGSFDPDEGQHEAGCNTCPNDTITAWQWDLNGAPFDYAASVNGAQIAMGTGFTTWFPTAGEYNIGLRVTDNTAAAYPGSGSPNLKDEDFAKVEVYNGCMCDLTATVSCQSVKLTWDVPGAKTILVYRSFEGPNTGFDILKPLDYNDCPNGKSFGSFIMDRPHWYRVMAVYPDGSNCMSKAVYAYGDSQLCNPTANPGGPYVTPICKTITLDGSASTAQVGNIVWWTWDLDNNGTFETEGVQVPFSRQVPGTYTIRLKVMSSDSLTLYDEAETTVEVTDTAPVAVLPGMEPVCAGDKALLDGSLSYDPDDCDKIVRWDWAIYNSLGNLVTEMTGKTAEFMTPTAGVYTICLKVTDQFGMSSETCKPLVIKNCGTLITIDIWPGVSINSVYLRKSYLLDVLVYGNSTLNVKNLSKVTFGATGLEAPVANGPYYLDYNRDGILDVKFRFLSSQCGFTITSTTGTLKAVVNGVPVTGTDSVKMFK